MIGAAALALLAVAGQGPGDAGARAPTVKTGTSPTDRPLFLASFPVESDLRGPLLAPGTRVTLRFDAKQARASNELVRRLKRPIARDGSLVVTKLDYPPARERPGKLELGSTFVIDFEEAPFKPVLAEARARLGAAPSVDAIVQFVDKFITKKTVARSFDVASVVAQRHEGDCTEHAVFLAAVARAFGIPARVAEGLVLVEVEKKVFAFGHAWVEVYRDAAWRPADAALVGSGPRLYLPLEILTDESPSYFMASARTGAAGTLGVRGILVTSDR